jgi:signal transduction histidine kinase
MAIAILGFALAYLLERNSSEVQNSRVQAAFEQVVSALDSSGGLPVGHEALPDPRYLIPASGSYWQITEVATGRVERSRSLWDFTIPTPLDLNGFAEAEGPSAQHLVSFAQTIKLKTESGDQPFRVLVAEERHSSILKGSRFGRDMTAALAFMFLAIMTAAVIQVRLVLSPIRRLRAAIEQIRHNNSTGIRGDFPEELSPLISELNDLLVIRENSLQFARARAADLAHGIKTPLSVFLSIADDLDARGDHKTAETVRELSAEISDRIGYQLQLARLRMRSRSEVIDTSLSESLRSTLAVLQRTHKGELLEWDITGVDDVHVDIDRHDLVELLGTLLENACKWATSQVALKVETDGDIASLTISDDGPGVSDDQLSSLGFRGRRLDESRPGSGMGLSIAKDIASLNKGSLSYARASTGGLKVTLALPLAGRTSGF